MMTPSMISPYPTMTFDTSSFTRLNCSWNVATCCSMALLIYVYLLFRGRPDAVVGGPGQGTIDKASAYIPFGYISDSRQRIDIYRKLSQATDKPALESLRRELRDRFGPLPRALDLLLHVAELKILASERGIAAIETKEDRLMLTRNNDYITLAGKFPRLTKQEPKARLNEVRKLLLAL